MAQKSCDQGKTKAKTFFFHSLTQFTLSCQLRVVNSSGAMTDAWLCLYLRSVFKHLDWTWLTQRTEKAVGGARVVVHHLQQVLELASILDGQLSQLVHVQQVVVDDALVADAQGKTVDLRSLTNQEQPITNSVHLHAMLTLITTNWSMEPHLPTM